MYERPLNIALVAWTDAGYQGYLEVTTSGEPQDWTGWTDLEFVAAESQLATQAAFTGTITTEAGKLLIAIAEETLGALLTASEKSKTFIYALRGRPVGTYRVRLMFGTISINKGLPDAA